MTNFEKWAKKHVPTEKDFVNFYNDLTREKGCYVCPLLIKCDFVNEETCKDKFLDLALEEDAKE